MRKFLYEVIIALCQRIFIIIIADDYPLFRTGMEQFLKKLLPSSEILLAESRKEIPELLNLHTVDLVFLDVNIVGTDSFELIKSIRKLFPHVKIIAVIMVENHTTVMELFESGANGYLNRNTKFCRLQKIIEIVFKGGSQLASDEINNQNDQQKLHISHSNSQSVKNPESSPLSNREIEILGLICQQLSSKEIAVRLNLTEKTVETHRNHLMWKTQSKNVVGLIMHAIEFGYFRTDQLYNKR